MAAAIPLILTVGGTAMSAFGQIQKAQSQKAMMQANARMAEQEGEARQQAYKEEAYKLSRERQRTIGQQSVIYGGSGLSLSSGTPLDVIANTSAEFEKDIAFAGLNADQARRRGAAEASMYRFGADQAEMAGWAGAGSTLLTGFGKGYDIWNKHRK